MLKWSWTDLLGGVVQAATTIVPIFFDADNNEDKDVPFAFPLISGAVNGKPAFYSFVANTYAESPLAPPTTKLGLSLLNASSVQKYKDKIVMIGS